MKLALAQLNPIIGDLDGNSEKIFEVCEEIKNKDIANALDLPPIKIHCSVLAEDSIHKAIEDYESKI